MGELFSGIGVGSQLPSRKGIWAIKKKQHKKKSAWGASWAAYMPRTGRTFSRGASLGFPVSSLDFRQEDRSSYPRSLGLPDLGTQDVRCPISEIHSRTHHGTTHPPFCPNRTSKVANVAAQTGCLCMHRGGGVQTPQVQMTISAPLILTFERRHPFSFY